MKSGKKTLSFFYFICLILVALIAGFFFTNKKTADDGQMLGVSTTPFDCSSITSRGKSFCNKKNLCMWTTKKMADSQKFVGECKSKLKMTATSCRNAGDVCCTDSTTGKGYCTGAVTCNPTKYTCTSTAPNQNLGQERGSKGTCSLQFKGASCMWKSDCAQQKPIGVPKLGYCQGPIEWQCCVPYSAGN